MTQGLPPKQGIGMRHRRRGTHRIKLRVEHLIPVVGLALWIGVLIIGILDSGQSYEKAATVDATKPVLAFQEQTGMQVRDSPLERRDSRSASDSSSPDPYQGTDAVDSPDSTAQSSSLRPSRAEPERIEPGAPGERRSDQTVSTAETSSQPAIEADADSKTGSPEDEAATPAEPDAVQPETVTETPASISSPHVARAQFTTGIDGREPVDQVESVFHTEGKSLRRLYYFTEITGLSGGTVTHRWEHEGKVMAEVPFAIGSDSWRVYSSKALTPSMEGPWRVVVTDAEGNTLKADGFLYKGP